MSSLLAAMLSRPESRDIAKQGVLQQPGPSFLPRRYAADLRTLQITTIFCSVVLAAAVLLAAVVANFFFLFTLPLVWFIVELGFYAWFRAHCHRLNLQPRPHKPSNYDAQAAFQKFIESAAAISQYMSLESCLSRWFYGAPYESIKRDNVIEFLIYGFWYTSREQLERDGLAHVPEMVVSTLEQAWNVTLEPGYNPNLRFMAHLWQPLQLHHRPLIVYLAMELVALLKHVSLLVSGFSCETHQGFVFYRRPGVGQGASKTPLVFLHGIGLGIAPYVGFVLRLAATGHPVVAIECRHLSMRLSMRSPGVDEAAAALDSYMAQRGMPSAMLLGHSFGTFLLSRMQQLYPRRVAAACFMDPVCFCLHTGHLLKNFVYRVPRLDSVTGFLLDLTVWWVSREVGCAAAVCRGFFWSQLQMWADQMPANSLVVLSAHDQVTPVPETRCFVEQETSATLMFHPKHAHADFIFDAKWQDKIVDQALQRLELRHSRHDSASSLMRSNSARKSL